MEGDNFNNEQKPEKESEIESDGHPVLDELDQVDAAAPPAVVEGKHMFFLRKTLKRTIDKCLHAGRLSLFAKTYPKVAKKNFKALQSIHEQYIENLQQAVELEIHTMLHEEQIVEFMNELDELTENAPRDLEKPAWRPTGDPNEDLRAHLVPTKQKQKERLGRLLSSLEEENDRLTKAILPRRQSLKVIIDKCDSMLKEPSDLPLTEVSQYLKAMAASNDEQSK